MRTILVAICGGSASGKSWLAGRLSARLPARTRVLPLDRFYRDLSALPPADRAATNFDHPDAIDWPTFEQALDRLRAGHAARVPRYDFATHSRQSPPETFPPSPLVLVEGLWLWGRPAAGERYALKLFLDCAPNVQLARRLKRDQRERGRTATSVRRQFETQVLPMQHRFVTPQRATADLVLRSPVGVAAQENLALRLQGLLDASADAAPDRPRPHDMETARKNPGRSDASVASG